VKHAIVLAALAFAACSPTAEAPAASTPAPTADTPAPAPAAASTDALTPTGWGALKIGMTKAEVVSAVGDRVDPNSVGGPEPESCDEFHPARAPDGLFVMLEDGKLSRITLTEFAKLKTSDGFGLGDDPAAIKTFYQARATASPHKYQDKPAEYITVWEGAARSEQYVQDPTARGYVYEVDGTGKVGAIHAGGPSIQYVEGCA
jgi:hypothetical protein